MKWIASLGGPLICLDEVQADLWGGIEKLTVAGSGAANDYERACRLDALIGVVPLRDGSAALTFGTGSLDTSVWFAPSGKAYIVSVECSEPDVDESGLLATMNDAIFEESICTNEVEFSTGRLHFFDSTVSQVTPGEPSFGFYVRPGKYRISTQIFVPDGDVASFIVHKLDHVSDVGDR